MLDLIVGATPYSLDDGVYARYQGEDGTGMAPLHRLEERGPMQHGVTDRGYRLDPRHVRLYLEIEGVSRGDLYRKRETLIRLFKPSSDLKLRWTLDDVRQLDVRYVGEMSMDAAGQRVFSQRLTALFKADDPTFYDPDVQAVTFNLGGGGGAFYVPMSVPHEVGASEIDQTQAIDYTGSWRSYPQVRIVGPITDPVITNRSTGEKLDFSGVTIVGGDYYDIDLRYGHKSVVDSSGVNKIADLTADSDLATWHLAEPQDAGESRDNSIRVQGTNVTETTKVEISYYRRFLGR